MKRLLIFLYMTACYWSNGQINDYVKDTATRPLIQVEKPSFLKSVSVGLNVRGELLHHTEHGRNDNFTEFRNSLVALDISGKVHEKVSFRFRNRFNRDSQLQSLDLLENSVELAFVNVEASKSTNIQVGKMFAYFGGYEYEFNPLDVLQYNDIESNLLAYVTGFGITQKITPNQQLGFQILNSRTMRYQDVYEGHVSNNVSEPKWPIALVLNWRGRFWDGKFETIYSYSRFRVAKGHGVTNAITLGNKLQLNKLTLMYDFNYSGEQLDTKGIVTNILQSPLIAEDATYIEHWVRGEYAFSSHFSGLLTLMSSTAYGNMSLGNTNNTRLRTSYGIVSTVYYRPFKDLDLRFFVAYIGRLYHYAPIIKNSLGTTNYHTNEFRIGLMAPLKIF